MKLLIISDTNDAHIPFVTPYLTNRPLIIGSLGLMQGNGYEIVGSSKGVHVVYNDRILPMPDTVFASSAKHAQDFITRHDSYIVKTLSLQFPLTKDNVPTFFYARRFTRGDTLPLEGLSLAPSIFQETIEPKFDIRVTVVGKKLFAAAIHVHASKKQSSNVLDWRAAELTGHVDYEAMTLPKDIAEKCIEHTRLLGLQYGAIDLIQDKHDKVWFLENNPNGQWAFIEEQTGQPIGKALAQLLETRES